MKIKSVFDFILSLNLPEPYGGYPYHFPDLLLLFLLTVTPCANLPARPR